MFEYLFNSRLVEKVLFYMEANNRCYANELHQALGTPVFGIQRALTRLENQGVLVSTIEGRNRIYHWNPRFPYLSTFRSFISNVYSSLPDTVKKRYYERPIRKRPRRKGKPLLLTRTAN